MNKNLTSNFIKLPLYAENKEKHHLVLFLLPLPEFHAQRSLNLGESNTKTVPINNSHSIVQRR